MTFQYVYAVQHVDDLITAERRVVHCFEEVSLLHFECLSATDYCSRRVAILKDVLSALQQELLSIDPSESPSAFAKAAKIRGDIYFLGGGDDGVHEGCILKWINILEDLKELASGTFVPHGRLYLPKDIE